ncbi:MAG: hypothetical protein ACRDFZ_00670 [Candidatus Limnocylindria bacterium]
MRNGWTIATAFALLLILIGLGIVVSSLPGEPTPTPQTVPLPITFGYALDPDTYLVTEPGDEFRPSDHFAYSVNPPTHPGVAQVYVAVIEYRAGAEVVLQPPSAQRLLPQPISFGYQTETANLIEAFGYGRFTMRIYLDPEGPVYAHGRFELVEPAVPR